MSAVNFTDEHAIEALAEQLLNVADYGVSRRYHAMKVVRSLELSHEHMPDDLKPRAKAIVDRLQTKFGRLSEKWPEPEYVLSPRTLGKWLCRRKNQYDHFLMIRKALQLASEGATEPTKIQTLAYQHVSYRTAHTPTEQTFMEWMIGLRILKVNPEGGYELGSQVPGKEIVGLVVTIEGLMKEPDFIMPPMEDFPDPEQRDVIAACQMRWPPVEDAPQLWRLLRGGWLLWDLDLCWPLVETELRMLYDSGRGMGKLKGMDHA